MFLFLPPWFDRCRCSSFDVRKKIVLRAMSVEIAENKIGPAYTYLKSGSPFKVGVFGEGLFIECDGYYATYFRVLNFLCFILNRGYPGTHWFGMAGFGSKITRECTALTCILCAI